MATGSARGVELIVGHTRDEYRLFMMAKGELGTITAQQTAAAQRRPRRRPRRGSQRQPGETVRAAALRLAVPHAVVPYVPSPAETPRPWAGFFDGYDDAEATSGHRLAQALVTRFATTPDPTTHRTDTHEVLITHTYQIAWLVRHALDAPISRWLGLNSANAALTIVEYRTGLPPTLVMFNDMSHLPGDLRWTGFPDAIRP